MLRVDVARHGEARLQDLLGVVQRSLQQLLEVLVLGHFLVAGLPPLSDGLQATGALSSTSSLSLTQSVKGLNPNSNMFEPLVRSFLVKT